MSLLDEISYQNGPGKNGSYAKKVAKSWRSPKYRQCINCVYIESSKDEREKSELFDNFIFRNTFQAKYLKLGLCDKNNLQIN